MSKLRPAQRRQGGKKITPETLRQNPALTALFRARAKELREAAKNS